MTKQLQSVTIKIGKKYYPLKVSENELKILGDIEKSINERIIDFLGKYKNLEVEDALAMILIETKIGSMKSDNTIPDEVNKVLDDIDQIITSV